MVSTTMRDIVAAVEDCFDDLDPFDLTDTLDRVGTMLEGDVCQPAPRARYEGRLVRQDSGRYDIVPVPA